MITIVKNPQEPLPIRLLPYDVEVLNTSTFNKDDEMWVPVEIIETYQILFCGFRLKALVLADSGVSFVDNGRVVKMSFKDEGRVWRKKAK